MVPKGRAAPHFCFPHSLLALFSCRDGWFSSLPQIIELVGRHLLSVLRIVLDFLLRIKKIPSISSFTFCFVFPFFFFFFVSNHPGVRIHSETKFRLEGEFCSTFKDAFGNEIPLNVYLLNVY